MGMGSRRERVAGLTCPGTWRRLDAGRAWGCLASCWAHCIHVRTRSLGAATASVPLTLLFNCLFSGKLEQEELWQWLQYPPAPRQQAVWDGEVRIPVQEERWVRMSVILGSSRLHPNIVNAHGRPQSWNPAHRTFSALSVRESKTPCPEHHEASAEGCRGWFGMWMWVMAAVRSSLLLFFLLRIRKVWQKRKCGVKYGCLTISHSTVGSVGAAALTFLCAPFGTWCPSDFRFSFAQTGHKSAWLQYRMGMDGLKKVLHV